MSIGSNPSGSLFYALAAGVAATISEHAPFDAEVAPYSGSSTFLPLLNEGKELEFGINNGVDMAMAYQGPDKLKIGGRNPFEHVPNTRLAIRGGAMDIGFYVRADSDIQHTRDLKGRKVAGEYPAHLAVWFNGYGLLGSCELSWDDVDVVSVPAVNDGMDALMDGRVEAAAHAIGSAKVREADAAIGVRALPICDDEAARKRIPEVVPGYYATMLPQGSTPGVVADTPAIAYDVYLTAGAAVPDAVVYEAVKAVWENQETLGSKHAALKGWTTDRYASADVTMPYHPGAIQFYKEKGVWTAEMEAAQQRLLQLGGN